MFRRMTATQVIRQLEKLPVRERRKVFAYVENALERREQIEDRKALEKVRRDSRPSTLWKEVKARIGLRKDETNDLLADPEFTAHLDRMIIGIVRYHDVPVRNLSRRRIDRWVARDKAGMTKFRATPRQAVP